MGGILLDTNILLELMRPNPAPRVMNWFHRQQGSLFFVSSITRAEIMLSISLLPVGRRRNNLVMAVEQMFDEDFDGDSLAFDDNCATEYALLVAECTRCGVSISTEDAQIAAIALRHDLPLATCNGEVFKDIERLIVLNPCE